MSARRKQPADDIARGRVEPGSNGLAARRVVEVQRTRMLAAMTEVSCERGASNVSVAHVVDRAGVSRRTFYEQFSDREDCFLATFEEALSRIAACVLPAYERPGAWRERIRASLIELLSFLDDDPLSGRLLIVETLGAGHLALERRGHVLAQLISAIDEGRPEVEEGVQSPPLTAEGVVGGVLSVLYARLSQPHPRGLIELANPLMSTIVLPYLGAGAARRELARPMPARTARPARTTGDPLRGLPMRLTYRTIMVLLALGELTAQGHRPSNRQLGAAAGITDQGQISKLLQRLLRLGLIENTGPGANRGERNQWRLTARGRELEGVLREGGGG